MVQHNVDFIGGDFNISAFPTIGDVFSDPEFAAPGQCSLLGKWWSGRDLQQLHGLPHHSSCLSVRTYGGSHGCYKFDNADLGFGPRDQTAHFTVFLRLRVTNLPGPTASCVVIKPNNAVWNGAAGRNDRKRLRKHLAQQSLQHIVSTDPYGKTSCFPEPRSNPSVPSAQLKRPLQHHRDMLLWNTSEVFSCEGLPHVVIGDRTCYD